MRTPTYEKRGNSWAGSVQIGRSLLTVVSPTREEAEAELKDAAGLFLDVTENVIENATCDDDATRGE